MVALIAHTLVPTISWAGMTSRDMLWLLGDELRKVKNKRTKKEDNNVVQKKLIILFIIIMIYVKYFYE